MDAIDLIKDALKYPLDDINAFLKLAIPNLLWVIIIIIGSIFVIGAPTVRLANLSLSFLGIVNIVLGIVFALFYSGLTIEIIRRTINNSKQLPELNFDYLIDGIKFLIISIVYCLPIIILTLIATVIVVVNPNYAIISVILALIAIVIGVITVFALILGMCRYAETKSMSEALDINNIYEIANRIGLANFIVITILIIVVGAIISFVMQLITIIPFIGVLIFSIVTTYLLMYQARAYGLLYLEQNSQNSPNNQYNQYNNQIPPAESNRLDFQNKNSQLENKEYQEPIKCQVCGAINQPTANNCNTCGYELKK